MTKKIAKGLRYLLLLVGACLLALLIRKIGLATIARNMSELGWLFLPILLISFGWLVLNTTSWKQFLNRIGNGIAFWDLFKIKLIGEAVNSMTPVNFIGGDPMRIHLLRKNFSTTEGAASVVVDRTLHSTATIIIILVGIVTAFLTIDVLPYNIKIGVPLVILISAGFIIFILVHQRRGIFGLMLDLCTRLGIKKNFSAKTIKRFKELDSHIMDFYDANHRGFLIALACHIAGRVLGIVEIYAIGRIVSPSFTPFAALILSAMTPMINAVFAFVPGALGVMEGAYGGALFLLHLDPAIGITIQIAKRIRAIFWVLLGLLFLSTRDRKRVWEEELIEEV